MKKTRLMMLTLGLALLLGSNALADDRYEEQSYTAEDPSVIQAIEITDTDVPIEIKPSGDGTLHVSYFTSAYEKYDIGVDNGTLHIIKQESFRPGFFWDFWDFESIKLTLYLPDGYAGALQVETADGDIRIDGITASGATITANDGDISIARSQLSGDVSVKTFDGDIRIDAIEAASLAMQTNDGDMFMDRPIIESSVSCSAFDGDIEGTLSGSAADYTLTIKTSDGDSNIVSGGSGPKQCDLKTADGDIVIFFEKE